MLRFGRGELLRGVRLEDLWAPWEWALEVAGMEDQHAAEHIDVGGKGSGEELDIQAEDLEGIVVVGLAAVGFVEDNGEMLEAPAEELAVGNGSELVGACLLGLSGSPDLPSRKGLTEIFDQELGHAAEGVEISA